MKIRVVKTEVTDKGKYKLLKVTYRNLETNKVMSQNCPSFSHPDVYNTLNGVASDSVYDIKVEKEGEYWNWVQASPSEAPVEVADSGKSVATGSGTGRAGTTTGRDWETREERALRQILIVRQSSVTAAIALGGSDDLKAVLNRAAEIEAWVFRDLKAADDGPLDVEAAMKEILAMKNDVPA